MIVRIARVKVGNRQAPYAVTSRTPVSPKENRGSGVYVRGKRQSQKTKKPSTGRLLALTTLDERHNFHLLMESVGTAEPEHQDIFQRFLEEALEGGFIEMPHLPIRRA